MSLGLVGPAIPRGSYDREARAEAEILPDGSEGGRRLRADLRAPDGSPKDVEEAAVDVHVDGLHRSDL